MSVSQKSVMLARRRISGYFFYLFLPVFTDDSQPDIFTTLAILVLVSISVNEIFVRVVGEYIGRIYRQLKRSTRVVVHRSLNLDD
jgi:hypothetical protein